MADIFSEIVNMSVSACWIILTVILLRLILRKAPKWINCVLWGIAGWRLVMPFSFESVISLIPSAEFVSDELLHSHSSVDVSGGEILKYVGNNPVRYELGISDGSLVFNEITAPDVDIVNPVLLNMYIFGIIWLVGVAVLSLYTVISFIRLKSKIKTAVLLRDNIYQSEAVVSPFVLGIIKPKIYLPFNMSEQNMEHVIAHETAHIKRKDYLWKPIGFLILTVHWFNPMVWLGYILFCRDMELACDERVVKQLNNEQRADYSEALLTCSVNRRRIAACPIAFGEVSVKSRIKSVLNYKKPALWMIVVALVSSAVVGVCFLTDPKTPEDTTTTIEYAVAQAILRENEPAYYDFATECAAEGHIIYGTEAEGDIHKVYVLTSYSRFGFENGYFIDQSGGITPAVMTFEKTDSGYELLDIEYVSDGSEYVPSIERLFPKKYQNRVKYQTPFDYVSLRKQEKAYAQAYLDKIGRTEEIREYREVEHPLLTELGVSVEVSNDLLGLDCINRYNHLNGIGYFESVEDGVRYIYRKDYNKEQNKIICTKEVYDTKEIVEKIEIDSLTGEVISQYNTN